jgi:hypothetical protein
VPLGGAVLGGEHDDRFGFERATAAGASLAEDALVAKQLFACEREPATDLGRDAALAGRDLRTEAARDAGCVGKLRLSDLRMPSQPLSYRGKRRRHA